MKISILVALNESISSRVMIDFIAGLPLKRDEVSLTLLHVYREPAAEEGLMGHHYTAEQPTKFSSILEQARDKLVETGFLADRISLNLDVEPHATVAEGLIDRFNKGDYDMMVIGRKNMSKAEEFVRGDISIKLIRALEGLCLLVVKTP